MNTVQKYQQQLLEQARLIYHETPLREVTENAYFAAPRHRFVRHYREWGSLFFGLRVADNRTVAP